MRKSKQTSRVKFNHPQVKRPAIESNEGEKQPAREDVALSSNHS